MQVTAAVLFDLQMTAYEAYADKMSNMSVLSFEEWRRDRRENVPQFRYWDIALLLELSVLQFVCSIRTGNFPQYIESLIRLVPWFFSLDHTHYARWVPVHIQDILRLEKVAPDLAEAFHSGWFTVQITKHAFSRIGLDHAHEQVNAWLKGSGGIVGITENEDALRKWLLAAPELSSMVKSFEEILLPKKNDSIEHHSENRATQTAFKSDKENFKRVMVEFGNPFLEESTSELYNIESKKVASAAVVRTVQHIEEWGVQHYENYVRNRLAPGAEQNFSDVIKKNKYALFSTAPARKSNTSVKLDNIKADCGLFIKLYCASQDREGDMDEFWSLETHDWPVAFTEDGGMKYGEDKSKLIGCLTPFIQKRVTTTPCVDAKFLDAAAFVRMICPSDETVTFGDYSTKQFLKFVMNECKSVNRLDVVFDR